MAEKKSGHATGMAGEFFVMERLFRLGHEPALTLGNAKSIDIIVRTKTGELRTISVKAVRGGGKWPVGSHDLSQEQNLIFVLLLYRDFDDVTTDPAVWVMPASAVEIRKRPWVAGSAVYYAHKSLGATDLDDYIDAWDHIT